MRRRAALLASLLLIILALVISASSICPNVKNRAVNLYKRSNENTAEEQIRQDDNHPIGCLFALAVLTKAFWNRQFFWNDSIRNEKLRLFYIYETMLQEKWNLENMATGPKIQKKYDDPEITTEWSENINSRKTQLEDDLLQIREGLFRLKKKKYWSEEEFKDMKQKNKELELDYSFLRRKFQQNLFKMPIKKLSKLIDSKHSCVANIRLASPFVGIDKYSTLLHNRFEDLSEELEELEKLKDDLKNDKLAPEIVKSRLKRLSKKHDTDSSIFIENEKNMSLEFTRDITFGKINQRYEGMLKTKEKLERLKLEEASTSELEQYLPYVPELMNEYRELVTSRQTVLLENLHAIGEMLKKLKYADREAFQKIQVDFGTCSQKERVDDLTFKYALFEIAKRNSNAEAKAKGIDDNEYSANIETALLLNDWQISFQKQANMHQDPSSMPGTKVKPLQVVEDSDRDSTEIASSLGLKFKKRLTKLMQKKGDDATVGHIAAKNKQKSQIIGRFPMAREHSTCSLNKNDRNSVHSDISHSPSNNGLNSPTGNAPTHPRIDY